MENVRTDEGDLTAEHREVLAFADRWSPYGGPEVDDVMTTFGLTMPQFRSLLLSLITHIAVDATLAARLFSAYDL